MPTDTAVCDDDQLDVAPWFDPSWLSPLSPLTPVDWRWRCAEHLAASSDRGRKPHWRKTLTDPSIWAAVAYLRSAWRLGQQANQDILIGHAQRLAGSPEIYRLQARLLAGLSTDQAAAAEGLDTEVVRWYALLFFDVAECLAAHDYIITHAVGSRTSDSGAAALPAAVRMIGYYGGPHLLDAVLPEVPAVAALLEAKVPPSSVPHQSDSVLSYLARALLLSCSVTADEGPLAAWLDAALSAESEVDDAFPGALGPVLRVLEAIEARKQRATASPQTVSPLAGEAKGPEQVEVA